MLGWAAQNAVVALVLAIVVAAVCRVCRLGPASRHALWLVVLVKLLTPSVVAWPWAIPILTKQGDVRSGRNIEEAPGIAGRDYVVSSETVTVSAVTVDEHVSPTQAAAEISSSASAAPGVQGEGFAAAEIDWLLLAYGIWTAGALVVGGLYTVRILRIHRLARRATPAPDWLTDEVTRAAAVLRIRSPRVAIAEGLATPVVWSLGRATLLWPVGLVGRERAETWRGVIVHELAHLRRRDHWTGWLELVAGTLWWLHPVYWYARHQLRENAELACDAWVVRLLPDARRTYAEALVSVCEFGSLAVPPPVPALGVHTGARRSLERRLTMILRERFPVRVSRGMWIAIVLLAVVAVPNWYLVAQAQPAADDAVVLAEPEIAAADEAIPTESSFFPPADVAETAAPDVDDVLSPPAAVEPLEDLLPSEQYRPRQPALGRQPRQRHSDQDHVVATDSFTFTRTTYRVPQHVADRLTRFLQQNLSWPHVLGTEIKDAPERDRRADQLPLREKLLVVTASPNSQEVIGGLIRLMLESKPRVTETAVNQSVDSDPFGDFGSSQFSAHEDPFGAEEDPFGAGEDPFSSAQPEPKSVLEKSVTE